MSLLSVNKFKCPFCKKVYVQKPSLYDHMDEKHHDDLNNLSPAHVYFNLKYHKTSGKCVICGKPTKFNENTERYERFDSDICKEKYREIFRKRMIRTYGKATLTNDPEQQKKMLAARKISGYYIWKDKSKTLYTGTYEKDALSFFEYGLGLSSKDVIAPAPQVFPYYYKGKKHQYIPDFFIVPYNLIVEIKGSNKGYRDRDYDKEILKQKAAEKNKKYHYIKILDKNYKDLIKLVNDIKNLSNDN